MITRNMMNWNTRFLTMLAMMMLSFIGQANSSFPSDPYAEEFVLASTDTIPFTERYENFTNGQGGNPFDLKDPAIVKQEIEYDPATGTYIITEKIGENDYRNPSYMTFDEYMNYMTQQQESNYFKELSGVSGVNSASGRIDPMRKVDVKSRLSDRLFGGTDVKIQPQGSIDLTFGIDYNKVENPILPPRAQGRPGFDFDMAIQMNVEGQIGEKLKLNTNFNTQATFDFDNQMKLDYDTDAFGEDEILKKIEAGNVSLPLRGSLIQGSQSLFGLKTELQFGKLWVTALASQQKSEQENITVQGGAQYQEFDVKADEYDENRHFFLSHYNREVFEPSLQNLPQISGLFKIEKIQVWVTNDRRETLNVRDIIAISDIGEPERSNMTNTTSPGIQPPANARYKDITGQRALPDNNANPIYANILANPQMELSNRATQLLRQAPFQMEQVKEFEKVTARQLSATEFNYNPDLGFISVNINVQPDQVLGVAYQYSYKDSVYQVGQFADDVAPTGDSIADQQTLYVKMLKSTTQNTTLPAWELMMKNIYSIGAFQVNQEDFRLNIYYEQPGGGERTFLPETNLAQIPLLNIFNLDNLNTQNDPSPDGVFDFIPGLTINPRNGRIMFPVLEPFGGALARQIDSPADSAKFVYQQLYDQTKTRAREFPQLNRFRIKGSYKSSVSSEISLGAFNIPEGSVRVTASGQQLQEGRDYEIDYNIGRVRILNDALLASGAPINISFEDNSLFSFQTKSMIGLRAEYRASENFNIGATYLHLFERPYTQKVNVGDDPINNRVYGVDMNYSTEAPWLTKAIDKLPLISTKETSTITMSAEAALLKPGFSKAIREGGEDVDNADKKGVTYIDDFEGSVSPFDLKNPANRWVLASIPANDAVNSNPLFPESAESNSTLTGVNRAKLSWHAQLGRGLSDQENPYGAAIQQQEVFPGYQNQSGFGNDNRLYTFDMTYYPEERGPYNYDLPDGTVYSEGLNSEGNLAAPATRWAGIMRDLTTNDFETSNIEFIEFWMMSPFLDSPEHPATADKRDREGDLYINLGNVSEDIMKDSRKFFENGLPGPEVLQPQSRTVETVWGKVPVTPQILNSFDNNIPAREAQDVGLDGLTDAEEVAFQDEYLLAINNASNNVPATARAKVNADPSSDNFVHFNNTVFAGANGASAINPDTGQPYTIVDRFKDFNGTQGNSVPNTTQSTNTSTTNTSTTYPDAEDINNDLTMNESESYFQYRVPIRWDGGTGIDQNNPFITDTISSANGSRIWYRFKIPLNLSETNENFKKVGGIQDFRSIRFMRMYMTGFEDKTTLRFARLDLVRNQWRRYVQPQGNTGLSENVDGREAAEFDVNEVNVEENGQKQPYNYVLPPGIERERALGVNYNARQNEQALTMTVKQLPDGGENSIYKLVNMDFRYYEGLKMFIHGEEILNSIDCAKVDTNDLTVYMRLGSDFTRNYYEYEIPLFPSSNPDEVLQSVNFAEYQDIVWSPSNNVEINFDDLTRIKKERNAAGASTGTVYSQIVNNRSVKVIGNPNLGDVKSIMIGVRNPAQNAEYNPHPDDDGLSKCAEVWINELRLFGLSEEGGVAATARVDVQIADVATVAGSVLYNSQGWGALDQNLQERSRDELFQFDAAASLQLDKFFPKKWGLKVPLYVQLSEETRTPQFDAYDKDILLEDLIAAAPTQAEKDEIKKNSQIATSIRSFNATNIRKERTNKEKKPMPYDLSNWSASYAQSTTQYRDPIVESDVTLNRMAALDYAYSNRSKGIRPFKNAFSGSNDKKKDAKKDGKKDGKKEGQADESDKKERKPIDKKYFKLITDFNFNPLPSSFSFSTQMDRQISETKYRFSSPDPRYSTFYNKKWTWDRNYSLNWNFAKALKFNFNAVATSVIDERPIDQPFDPFDEIYKGRIDNDLERDLVLNNIKNLGRDKRYSHNFSLNYTVPLKQIPFLDWINLKASYQGSYNWDAASVNSASLGNVIANSQNRQINGDMDFRKLYKKSKFLKQVEATGRTRNTSREPAGRGGKDGKDGKGSATKKTDNKTADKEKSGKMSKGTKALIRPLLLLRSARLTYSENLGTVIPGYTPETDYFGLANGFSTPGWEFVAGLQPTISQETYYDDNDYLYNNWEYISRDQLLNQQVSQTYAQNINAKVTLEPVKGFKIDLEATKQYSKNHTEFFRRDTIFQDQNTAFQNEFEHLIPRDVGSYTISYFAMQTLFQDSIATLFENFKDNRLIISDRLGTGQHVEDNGYDYGYGEIQNAVLMPAFIAAYTGQDPATVEIDQDYTKVLLKQLPIPNWRIKYDGLSKLDAFKDVFKRFSLTHGYKSTLTVNSFATDLLYDFENEQKLDVNNNYYSRFEIPGVQISEQFAPLLGLQMEFQNSVSIDVDFKKSRTLAMDFNAFRLAESKQTEYRVGFGYRMKGVNLFGKKKKKKKRPSIFDQLNGEDDKNSKKPKGGVNQRENKDLDINFDFSYRDDISITHELNPTEINQATRGATEIRLSPSAEYQLNEQLSLRFFFDYSRNIPKTSQQFPRTTALGGVTVRFTLQ